MSNENVDAGTKSVLRVLDAGLDDVGKGLARVDENDLKMIKAVPGDLVKITGKKSTVARASQIFHQYKGQKVIQIDGITRENSGALRDEWVSIEKVLWKPCEILLLSPIDTSRPIPKDEELRHLVHLLNGLPLINGDKVQVTFFGARGQFFLVEGTSPSGPVVVNINTQIKIREPEGVLEKTSRVSYEDIGGLEREVYRIREMVELPLKFPDLFARMGIEAPKGVLMYGPPGTGKTLIARAVASEVKAHFIHINGPEIIHKFYGESEAKLREVFEEASRNAPSIVFLDEIDAIAPKRVQVIGDVEKRVVAQLLSLMDGLISRGQVVVIGATNVPELVDPALRRPGRFDREIAISIPNRLGRREILQIHTRTMPLAKDFDIDAVASITHGFVGADIEILAKEAGMRALRRALPDIVAMRDYKPFETEINIEVTQEDFLEAFREVEPTATREFLAERPTARFSDIGGLEKEKETLRSIIELPLKHSTFFDNINFKPPQGILFSGPTGTGKTALARALAGENELTLITVDQSVLLSKWMGESEKAMRALFKMAIFAAPCMIFFDEIDGIASKRGELSGELGGGGSAQRMVSQLLRELDGLKNVQGVMAVAATNRLDLLDTALLRPGRFDYIIELPIPDEKERLEIFKVYTKTSYLDKDVDLEELANKTEGYVGADIESLVKKATLLAVQGFFEKVGSKVVEK
jgi:transitional endoplasmic reticulum ATPase